MSKGHEAIVQWRTEERKPQLHRCEGVRPRISHTVLPERSIVNITENICISVVSVEMQMSSDTDLLTFGLCVHVATTATEQGSYYTILISEVCASSTHTHTGSAIWSLICVQLNRYIITFCQETVTKSRTQISQMDSIVSPVEFTTL
jgi:hypothetical protein